MRVNSGSCGLLAPVRATHGSPLRGVPWVPKCGGDYGQSER